MTTELSPEPPQQPHGEDDRLLTIDEVADLVRLPVATLRYKRYDGTGPHSFRLGRYVRYWLSDVLGWVAQHCDDDTSD